MKTYSQLTTVDRGAPCQEYPGTWYLYVNGREVEHFSGASAETCAHSAARHLYVPYENCVEVCWSASDDDPRIGQVWFTPYYNALRLGSTEHKRTG